MSVLGGLMLNNKAYIEVAERICDTDFYRADHQMIFRAIAEMVMADKPCDFVTLGEHLRHRGRLDEAGGVAYLGSLTSDAYSVSNILQYADVVRERSVQRQLIGAGQSIGDLGYRPEGRDAAGLLEEAERTLHGLRQHDRAGAVVAAAIMPAVNARIERAKAGIMGLRTGFLDLDRLVHALEPGDVTIVAARPGAGKTSLALAIAEHHAVDQQSPVAVFSMEMSSEQLVQRLLSSNARVPLSGIRSGRLDDREMSRLVEAQARLTAAPLYIDPAGALSPTELRARARRLVTKHGIKLAIVDYVQLMQVRGSENRTNEVSEISRNLKAIAKELNIPIIALSQLNRGVENRENKRPRLADLRESGGLEQDADIVLFIYRDEMYNESSKERGIAELIVAKNRNGPLGTARVCFIDQFTQFTNLADASFRSD